MADYVLKYLQVQPFPTVPIVSCSNHEQLVEAMHSMEAKCDEEVMKKITALKGLTEK